MSAGLTFFTNDMSSGAWQTPYESKVEGMLQASHFSQTTCRPEPGRHLMNPKLKACYMETV